MSARKSIAPKRPVADSLFICISHPNTPKIGPYPHTIAGLVKELPILSRIFFKGAGKAKKLPERESFGGVKVEGGEWGAGGGNGGGVGREGRKGGDQQWVGIILSIDCCEWRSGSGEDSTSTFRNTSWWNSRPSARQCLEKCALRNG